MAVRYANDQAWMMDSQSYFVIRESVATTGTPLLPLQSAKDDSEASLTITTAPRLFINCTVYPGRARFPNAYDTRYTCRQRDRPRKLATQTAGRPVVRTNLHIAFQGDSVGMQLAGAFQRSCYHKGDGHRRPDEETLMNEKGYDLLRRARTADGSTIWGWRLSGLWNAVGEDMPLRQKPRISSTTGGWNRTFTDAIRSEGMARRKKSKESLTEVKDLPLLDALIVRLSQGWTEPEEVTRASMKELVDLAIHFFPGLPVVLFLTLPICNNYKTLQDLVKREEANHRVREFAKAYNDGASLGAQPLIMVLDFGELVTKLARRNGENIVFPGSFNSTLANHDDRNAIFLPRVGPEPWTRPAALVCGGPPYHSNNRSDIPSCVPNQLSVDGMHLCLETLAGRIVGGVSCQLDCALRMRSVNDGWYCSERCNAKFMHDIDVSPVWNKEERQ